MSYEMVNIKHVIFLSPAAVSMRTHLPPPCFTLDFEAELTTKHPERWAQSECL